MSFDEIFDLTAGRVYFYFYNIYICLYLYLFFGLASFVVFSYPVR